MSISSMLGADADRHPRDATGSSAYGRPSMSSAPTTPAPAAAGTPAPGSGPGPGPSGGGDASAPSLPARTMSPSSAGHTRQPSSEFPSFGRSRTPDRTPFSKPPIPVDRSHFGSSGRTMPPHGQTSPDDKAALGSAVPVPAPARPQTVSHFGGDNNQQSTQSPPSGSSVEPTPASYNQDRRMSLGGGGGPLPRPSSQPHFDDNTPRRTTLFSSSPAAQPPGGGGGHHREGATLAPPGYATGIAEHQGQAPPRFGGTAGSDVDSRYGQDQSRRPQQEYSASVPPEPRYHQQGPQSPQDRLGSDAVPRPEAERSQQRPAWDLGFQRQSPEAVRTAPAVSETSSADAFGFGAIQNYTKSLGSQLPTPRSVPGGPRQEPTLSGDASPATHRSHSSRPYSPTPRSQMSFAHASSAAEEQQQQPRGGGVEASLQHKNVLHVNTEGKREGRVSPLPQAVQGAQAPLLGPPGEGGIKNELGRVFSGIGSGVGASAAGPVGGSGSSTPMPSASPFKSVSARSEPIDGDLGGAGKPARTGSGAAKRNRKNKAEDGKAESEASSAHRDGASTQGTPAGRGGGRHVHHHHHRGHQ